MSRRSRRVAVPVARVEPGTAPGSLASPPGAVGSTVNVLAYGPETLEETPIESVEEIRALRGRHAVTWINVDGLGDAGLIQELGDLLGLHRLALEDVLHLPQRPKLEPYPDQSFLVFRMPVARDRLETEQVSLFLGSDYVLTFQERTGDCFDPVRRRIRSGRPRIRGSGPDYLTYALLDVVVDSHFPLLETYGARLAELEEAIVTDPATARADDVQGLKRDLATLRRYVWPLREIHAALARGDEPVVAETTQVYLRDSADHTNHVLDLIDSYEGAASGLMDLHLALMSQRMNEVMKVLTIIATIFIPLSFIAGLYGMNFDPDVSAWNLPELRWKWGYPFALGIMATVTAGMLFYFRARGWFR